MRRGKGLVAGRLVAMASAAAVLAGGCMVVLSENEPPKIYVAPRPVRAFVVVPAVTGQQFGAAETILAEGRLNVGDVRYVQSSRPAGSVIDQTPNAGEIARSGTAVTLTLAVSRAQARVPNVVGKGLIAAKIALRISGLKPGNVTYREVPGVTIPRVGSQSYPAGGLAALGAPVDLVIDSPSAKIRIPAIAGKRYIDALRDLHSVGLRVTGLSSRQHATVEKGHVVSQSPSAGSLVDPGTGVSVVLSAGSGRVAVPFVTEKTPSSAIRELHRAGLRPTVEYRAMAGVPGRVASQSPTSGTMVDRGTVVTLVARKALPAILRVTVPDVKGRLPGEAKAILTASGLAVGSVSQGVGRPGRVVSQAPGSGSNVARGASVALVVGRIVVAPVVRVSVPNVVGLQEAAAASALRRVGLDVGTVTSMAGARPGSVLRQSPSSGNRVARGTKVDLSVAKRIGHVRQTSVPNLVGQQEAAARTTLLRYGLKVGTVTKVRGIKDGDVVRQSPTAGNRVLRGSSVNLTVSTRRVVAARVSVPNVVGMQEGAASAALRRVGLVVGAVTKATGIREGSVIRQSPSMGARVARGSKVDLTVSTRKVTTARVTVPSVVGQQEGAANAALRRAGLAVGTVTKAPGALPGRVLRQSPSARASVVRGTKVNLVVSVKRTTGRPTPPTPPAQQLIAVPNVVGMSLGQARSALKKISLDVGTVSRKRVPRAKRGRIAAQAPTAGSRVAKGTKVNLVFAY